MRINPIQPVIVFQGEQPNKKHRFGRYSWIPITGYTSLGFGVASGFLASRKRFPEHKITAYIALAAAFAHIALLKTMHALSPHKPQQFQPQHQERF